MLRIIPEPVTIFNSFFQCIPNKPKVKQIFPLQIYKLYTNCELRFKKMLPNHVKKQGYKSE